MTWTKKIKKEQIEDFISDSAQTALDDRARTAVNCNVLGTPTALSSAPGVVVYQKTFSANEFVDLDTLKIESINEKNKHKWRFIN